MLVRQGWQPGRVWETHSLTAGPDVHQDKISSFSAAAWKPAAKALTFSPLFVPAILFPEFQPDKTVHNVQNNTATKTHFQIYQNRMIWLSLYCNLDTKMTFPVFTESVLYNF